MAENKNKKDRAKELTEAELEKRRAKQAESLEVTEASEWKSSNRETAEAAKLLLPSGNVCLAQNPGLEPFIEEGLIPNSLLTIVLKAIKTGKGIEKDDLKDMEQDPERLADIIRLANTVLVRCVLAPDIFPVPLWTMEDVTSGRCSLEMVGKEMPMGKRKEGPVYADMVDMDDKFFIFQWAVGGTRDVERFRDEQTALVADVSTGQGVGSETE